MLTVAILINGNPIVAKNAINTKALAEKYVHDNYAELAKLIDLDTVNLLATRKLAGMVASEGSQ